MARGGARPGAGRPKGSKNSGTPKLMPYRKEASAAMMTPLEYMMSVMGNPDADPARRDRMAQAAAPYVHARAEPPTQKEGVKAAADRAANGRYATPAPPKLAVDNTR